MEKWLRINLFKIVVCNLKDINIRLGTISVRGTGNYRAQALDAVRIVKSIPQFLTLYIKIISNNLGRCLDGVEQHVGRIIRLQMILGDQSSP